MVCVCVCVCVTSLQMDVAVKTLRVDAMGHGEQEFMREAKIMVTLNHPCIVKLIGVSKGKPMMLVCMYVGGGGGTGSWSHSMMLFLF